MSAKKPAYSHCVWLRNDLRLHDNPALYKASLSDAGCCAVVIPCTADWQRHNRALAQVELWFAQVKHLSILLQQRGIPLYFLKDASFENLPDILSRFCREHSVQHCYWNAEYPVDEIRRDKAVEQRLSAEGYQCHASEGDLILSPKYCLTEQGAYKVFTPFKKRAIAYLQENSLRCCPLPKAQKAPLSAPSIPEFIVYAGKHCSGDSPYFKTEKAIIHSVQNFIAHKISNYKAERDYPSSGGTSQLSPYLAIGALSIKALFQKVLLHNNDEYDSGCSGVLCYLSELLWREFYRHILIGYPKVGRNQNFQEKTNQLVWNNDVADFEHWQAGTTGMPIVDAAMRCLQQTHWMHNRLRMIVAMYLTKNYLIDWRWGEAHFMRYLVDGDHASNNGGWQWSASTGTDAAPYFRMFHPGTQAKKFDSTAAFIHQWVPELRHCTPSEMMAIGEEKTKPPKGYPALRISQKRARERVLSAFQVI